MAASPAGCGPATGVSSIERVLCTLSSVPSSRTIASTLSLLRPEDLFPAWRYVDLLEEMGEMHPREARRWKEGVYGLMVLWGMEPDDLLLCHAVGCDVPPRTSAEVPLVTAQ